MQTKQQLETRIERLRSMWATLPNESLQLLVAAEAELEDNNLAAAYCLLVLADSYVLVPAK